jgi:hypothetical protein
MTNATQSQEQSAMTPQDVEVLAHNLRLYIQSETCCPHHAGEVLLRVLAGFALDDAEDDKHEAAATLVKGVKQCANKIRSGEFSMLRTQQ